MWRLFSKSTSALRMPAMFVFWVLEGWSRGPAFDRGWSYVLCVRDSSLWIFISNFDCHLGMDASTGSVFCSACDDFVHHPSLETAYVEALLAVEEKNENARSQGQFLDFILWAILCSTLLQLLEDPANIIKLGYPTRKLSHYWKTQNPSHVMVSCWNTYDYQCPHILF